MKLSDLKRAGYSINIDIKLEKDTVIVREIDDITVESRFKNCTVNLVVLDPSNAIIGDNGIETSMVVCNVKAFGSGKTIRSAENSGIKECLKRVKLLKIHHRFHHHIDTRFLADIESDVDDEITKCVLVTLIIFDSERLIKGMDGINPKVTRNIKAIGCGKTIRDAERDGIKECLKRAL